MPDPAFWLVFLALVAAGCVITRFNPAVMYLRGTLIGLAVFAIVLIGVVLMLGFYGTPTLTRSGVFNINGG